MNQWISTAQPAQTNGTLVGRQAGWQLPEGHLTYLDCGPEGHLPGKPECSWTEVRLNHRGQLTRTSSLPKGIWLENRWPEGHLPWRAFDAKAGYRRIIGIGFMSLMSQLIAIYLPNCTYFHHEVKNSKCVMLKFHLRVVYMLVSKYSSHDGFLKSCSRPEIKMRD